MRRRRYLAALAAGTTGVLAGCAALPDGSGTDGDSTDAPTDASGTGASGGTADGDLDLPVPESELTRGAAKDAIPAITDPVFAADWSGLDGSVGMNRGDRVLGVARGGEARAYPLKVLNWHEIVNDTLDGPLLVTYCPLCGSAITAVRTVDGEPTTFGVSGFLFRNDLVMYDEATGSLWSQIVATAINGPKTGTELELLPSSLTTWGAWQAEHDDPVVLLPPPESSTVVGPDETRPYGRNPYAGYEASRRIGLGGSFDDDRLHPKATVVGIRNDGAARAYPLDAVASADVVNDEVGGLPVVVTVAPGDTLVAYERTVEGEVLSVEAADDRHLRAGGSRWRRATGEAVDGPHDGTQLARANDASPMFFFAWKDFNRETEVYGAG